jgi:uncharacterized protein YecE (DUF72 family)
MTAPPFDLSALARDVADLAARNLYLGTSSWKYPGWVGQLYEEQRYIWRGKFSESRFDKHCLNEYATVFKTVCVDAGYYRFPSPEFLGKLAAQVPDDFRFSFKVTDEITVRDFPRLPRFGNRGGQTNPHFLDADLFAAAFLEPCEGIREKVGLLMFEFSHFHKGTFDRGRDFVTALDAFLNQLPNGWQFGVEIRNRTFLHPEYFAMLAERGVTHVFNHWTRMLPVGEQLAMEGSRATDFFGARFLLTPGRNYAEAVADFSPYTATRREDPAAREAGAKLLAKPTKRRSYLYVNNRLEGNAINTIRAMITRYKGDIAPPCAPEVG